MKRIIIGACIGALCFGLLYWLIDWSRGYDPVEKGPEFIFNVTTLFIPALIADFLDLEKHTKTFINVGALLECMFLGAFICYESFKGKQ